MMSHNQKSTIKYLSNANNNQEGKNNKRLRIKSHEAIDKPKRKRITPYQFSILSDLFANTDTPNYQLREDTAEKLNMTNREVQVWFQNRRAKVRNKMQEQKKQDPFIYPICWNPPEQQHTMQDYTNQTFNNKIPYQEENNTYDSQSSVTSSNSSTPTLYPQLLPHMRPIDILALAAEYVQRCDEEKKLTEERRKCWRPWD